jgi:predicted O-methyltransferase YrrM
MSEFQFTNNWFDASARGNWDQLIPLIKPTKILEVGSYEGASTCYLIKMLSQSFPLEIHCIDTWKDGVEHKTGGFVETDMSEVESRFLHNIKVATENPPNPVALFRHKGSSDIELAKLLVDKQNYFDFIYIDGSHQAPDVLCDALLSFRLLKIGGLIAFDDYLWAEALPYGTDPIRCPKTAIDAFTNIYCRKVKIISALLYQLYVQKISDY